MKCSARPADKQTCVEGERASERGSEGAREGASEGGRERASERGSERGSEGGRDAYAWVDGVMDESWDLPFPSSIGVCAPIRTGRWQITAHGAHVRVWGIALRSARETVFQKTKKEKKEEKEKPQFCFQFCFRSAVPHPALGGALWPVPPRARRASVGVAVTIGPRDKRPEHRPWCSHGGDGHVGGGLPGRLPGRRLLFGRKVVVEVVVLLVHGHAALEIEDPIAVRAPERPLRNPPRARRRRLMTRGGHASIGQSAFLA